jgi:hypothetical protein
MAQSKMRPSAVPGKKAGPNGSFPVGDPKHARLAIGGATRSARVGNISAAQEAKIKAAARAELAKKGGGKPAPKKKAAVPEFAAGRRSFGGRSFGPFNGGPAAPGLGAGAAGAEEAPDAEAPEADEAE